MFSMFQVRKGFFGSGFSMFSMFQVRRGQVGRGRNYKKAYIRKKGPKTNMYMQNIDDISYNVGHKYLSETPKHM
jgi:hypothetical protein